MVTNQIINFAGVKSKAFYPIESAAVYLNFNDATPKTIVFDKNQLLGYGSGRMVQNTAGYKMLEIQFSLPVFGTFYAWVDSYKVKTLDASQKATADAEASGDWSMLMVNNDLILFKRLLVLGAFILKLKAQGVNTSEFDTQFLDLHSSYFERQIALKQYLDSNNLSYTRAYPNSAELPADYTELYNQFQSYLTSSFSGVGNLGVFGIDDVVIIAVILICVGIGYALSNTFKPYYEQGKVNLKTSDDLLKALNTLPADKKDAVVKDLQTQLQDAYMGGKSDGSTGGIIGTIKTVVIIAGAAWAGFTFLPKLFPQKKAE